MIDRWGNAVIETPKTMLYTMTPENVHRLLEAASCIRDRAAISLLADSGARRSEIVVIKTNDVDLGKNCIKVIGKGNKEGYLIFGEVTKAYILRQLEENSSVGTLFDLDTEGLKTMLRRLHVRTGIKCNAHSFRRGFATELRRKGLSELDIAELGRWSSTEMVQRYSRAYTFQDAATRYMAVVS
jgi:integrase/recombinase XerC